MAAPNNPPVFNITLPPETEAEFERLVEAYGIGSAEAVDFLLLAINKEIEILIALEERSHARIH